MSDVNYDCVEKAQDRRSSLRTLGLSRSFLFLYFYREGGCCGLSACSVSMQQGMMLAIAHSTGILGQEASEPEAVGEPVNA